MRLVPFKFLYQKKTEQGCEALSVFVNVFAGEEIWDLLAPHGCIGSCSSRFYYYPKHVLKMWKAIQDKDWSTLKQLVMPIHLAAKNFERRVLAPLGYTDTAFDRLGGLRSGVLSTSHRSRGPYRPTSAEDVEMAKKWYQMNLPELE